MNCKIMAIIIATSIATAVAVVYAVQEYHYNVNRRRFSDIADDEYDLDHGEQCRHPNCDLT